MILAFANANYHVEPMADKQAMHWPRDELIILKLELSY